MLIPLLEGIFQNRRLYSSTVSQQPASSARTSHTLLPEEFPELLLPGPVKYIEHSTPMITKSELDEFFYPLFRRGWEIKRLEANDSPSHLVRDIWCLQSKPTLNSYGVSRTMHPLFWYENSASKATGLLVHSCKRPLESKVKKK